jgi:hypothetical protein
VRSQSRRRAGGHCASNRRTSSFFERGAEGPSCRRGHPGRGPLGRVRFARGVGPSSKQADHSPCPRGLASLGITEAAVVSSAEKAPRSGNVWTLEMTEGASLAVRAAASSARPGRCALRGRASCTSAVGSGTASSGATPESFATSRCPGHCGCGWVRGPKWRCAEGRRRLHGKAASADTPIDR